MTVPVSARRHRAAGIVLTWDDMDLISQTVPLLARVYPNGSADVNAFQAAGGVAFVTRELAEAWRPHRGAAAIFTWHHYGAGADAAPGGTMKAPFTVPTTTSTVQGDTPIADAVRATAS